ncbi:MAG: hypothetical protein ACXWF8_00030 [Methylobacter sp.]
MDKKQEELLDTENLLHELIAIQRDVETKISSSSRYEEQFINISLSECELIRIIQGLNLLGQSLVAEQYIKDSIGTDISDAKRWETVAEIMLLKEPGEKISKYGSNEICFYAGAIKAGFSPHEASLEVFKRSKFPSHEACKKWLCREIESRKKQNVIFSDLPKPSSWPKLK